MVAKEKKKQTTSPSSSSSVDAAAADDKEELKLLKKVEKQTDQDSDDSDIDDAAPKKEKDTKKAVDADSSALDEQEVSDFNYHYYIFSILFMNACLIHTRNYYQIDVVIAALHLIAAMFYKHHHEAIFLSFLCSAIFSTYDQSPYNANHHNVVGYVSVLLLPAQIKRVWYGMTKNGGDSKENILKAYKCTTDALNVVRWAIIIMYWFTGFHKLNSDFLDPTISCAFDKIFYYFHLIGGYRNQDELVEDLPFGLAYKLPIVVVFLELFAPVLFYFGSTQWMAVALMLQFHLILLPMGFSDFGTIASSFLLLFIPSKAVKEAEFSKNYFFDMAGVFIFIEILTFAVWYFEDEDMSPMRDEEAAAVLMAYGVIWAAIFRAKSLTKGSTMFFPKSWASRGALLAFIWFAMNPYLGLRTAGNLTMFSNLRTEGPVSNHLLLRSNPLKIYDYQEDTIKVLEHDERWIRNYMNVDTNVVPKLEFQLEVDSIREDFDDIDDFYLNFVYKGVEYETEDLYNDETMKFLTDELPWYHKKYMRFRRVQESGTRQECSW
mmetsp:Transcript_1029/g.2232  ORF Transcript_1029/g.2232 Transcript_1029/m.2232 type:complete len:547 (-) Transcript_1029:132-1772(-)